MTANCKRPICLDKNSPRCMCVCLYVYIYINIVNQLKLYSELFTDSPVKEQFQ